MTDAKNQDAKNQDAKDGGASTSASPTAKRGWLTSSRLRLIAILIYLGSIGLFIAWVTTISGQAAPKQVSLENNIAAVERPEARRAIEDNLDKYEGALYLSQLVLVLALVLAYAGTGLHFVSTFTKAHQKRPDAEGSEG